MLVIESYLIKNKSFFVKDMDAIDERLFIPIGDLQAFDKSTLDYDYIHGGYTDYL